jgi:hypothetical protein
MDPRWLWPIASNGGLPVAEAVVVFPEFNEPFGEVPLGDDEPFGEVPLGDGEPLYDQGPAPVGEQDVWWVDDGWVAGDGGAGVDQEWVEYDDGFDQDGY